MLYLLYSYLDINLFQYISVRAGIGFFMAFLLTIFLMPKFISWAKSKKASQPIYHLAPQSHKGKKNTPTMGGAVFVFSTLIASLFVARLDNFYVIFGIFTILFFFFIGLKDDVSKILGQKNELGLSPKAKFRLQLLFAFIISLLLYFIAELDSYLYIPFYKHPVMDMKLLAILFWTAVIVATSNAVNLTDGLDGLATVPSIFSLTTLCVITYISGHAIFSSYLLVPKIMEVGEVVIIGASMIGALIGFLWYNCHPAQVFMGDSGSLTIGAYIAYMAIISQSEILLLLIGFIFVLETVSVILQISSYKTRGKRVFLMAPIHHHFEMKGWAENKIIVRFWIIAFLTNMLALITLKIR
ncbi:MAG: phospho-N-acetylmuramoyl-pentapeptide-transferase [Campylobacterales bacterium]|nr:phospho-N-acetylmuramoyl-pentapeptide-transferase [Campylobacterales bacterium]